MNPFVLVVLGGLSVAVAWWTNSAVRIRGELAQAPRKRLAETRSIRPASVRARAGSRSGGSSKGGPRTR